MKIFVASLLALVLLQSCAVHTPRGTVVVDPPTERSGSFCPPGQAKKGRC